MRPIHCAALAGATVFFAAGATTSANAQIAERELLGVRIWRSYTDVLQKMGGAPDKIEAGGEGGSQAGGAGGGMAGGGAMMGGGGSIPAPGFGGGMGMSGGGGMGAPMMGGASGAPGLMSGGGGGGGKMGGLGLPGMGGMGMPGMGGMSSGGGGAMAGDGGMGAPRGGMGGGMGAGQASAGEDGEVTWVYNRGANVYRFLFNKDGRVIQIQAYGYKPSGVKTNPTRTTRGQVDLGDGQNKILGSYQWPSKTINMPNGLVMDYSGKSHVVFQLANRNDGKGLRVVGITVAETERGSKAPLSMGAGGGAPGGMMGAPGGMGMGMPGGMGMGMPGMGRPGGFSGGGGGGKMAVDK